MYTITIKPVNQVYETMTFRFRDEDEAKRQFSRLVLRGIHSYRHSQTGRIIHSPELRKTITIDEAFVEQYFRENPEE